MTEIATATIAVGGIKYASTSCYFLRFTPFICITQSDSVGT